MDNQEAIEWIKKIYIDTNQSDRCLALKMAIAALGKQIPERPVTYKETNRADCPICGGTVRGIDKPFGDWCSGCGQAIDWD